MKNWLILTVLFTIVFWILPITSIPAQTLLRAGYWQRMVGEQSLSQPEIEWEQPGAVSLINRFCLYRTKTLPEPDISNRINIFNSYPPSNFSDVTFEEEDYAYLATTGLLNFWGVLGQNCQFSASGSGLTPNTTVTTAVPNISATGSAQGMDVSLQISIPHLHLGVKNYEKIYVWALGDGVEDQVIQEISGNPGVVNFNFTIGGGEGEILLPSSMEDLDSIEYRFGVSGVLEGADLENPRAYQGFPDHESRSSRLSFVPDLRVTVTESPTPEPTPNPPSGLTLNPQNTADVVLSWINGDNDYTSIQIFQNEKEVAQLPGNAVGKVFLNQPFGQVSQFGIMASRGDFHSPLVSIELINPPMPSSPQGLMLVNEVDPESIPEQIQGEVFPPANEIEYVHPNNITGYEIRITKINDGSETFYYTPTKTFSLEIAPGQYTVSARTVTHPQGGETTAPVFSVFSTESNAVTVSSQPVATLELPIVGATHLTGDNWYEVFFTLSTDQREATYDRVDIMDDSGSLKLTLNDLNGWQDTLAVNQVGTISGWTAIGHLGNEFSEDSPLPSFEIPLKTPHFWYWINDQDASGQITEAPRVGENGVGRHIHLKILPNFPTGNPYGENQKIFVELWSGGNDDPPEDPVHTVVEIPGDPIAAGEYVYHTHSLPANHSQAGDQKVQIYTKILDGGPSPEQSEINEANFSIGVLYGYLQYYSQKIPFGDFDNNNVVDKQDIRALSTWWFSGDIVGQRPACLESFNGDEDAYIPIPPESFPNPSFQIFWGDPRSQYCDGPGNPESLEDLAVSRPRPYRNGDTPQWVQEGRKKPKGFYSEPPSDPTHSCYYDRDEDPNHPVYNELQALYPGADAYCRYGPYEVENQAKPGNANPPESIATDVASGGDDQIKVDPRRLYEVLRHGVGRAHVGALAISKEDLEANSEVSTLPPPPPPPGDGDGDCVIKPGTTSCGKLLKVQKVY